MGYIPSVRDLLRKSPAFFLLAALGGVVLRVLFVLRFPSITADSFIYGDIGKNWLRQGIYGLSSGGGVFPTDIRLPGYPAFLAAVFAIFGMEHYRTVLVLQVFVDLGTCFLIADIARRVFSDRVAKAAFLLAALCPFLANYNAAVLTETLEVFCTVMSIEFAIVGLTETARRMWPWIGCGLAAASAILLRPDGGLLPLTMTLFLAYLWLRSPKQTRGSHLLKAGLVVALLSAAPLLPWTLRNFLTLHHFQPLAPRYANEENEFVPMGFNQWVKTWIVDYVSVEEIYWQAPGATIDGQQLPARSFDSESQRERTLHVLDDYNAILHITPPVDAGFAALAAERIRDHPLRYYLWLPLLRIADMWLRPRTEILHSDTRWWEFDDDPRWSALAVSLGAINLLYLAAAAWGLTRIRLTAPLILLLGFVVLRSAFLGTLENPEPRYTLECCPVIVLLAAGAMMGKRAVLPTKTHILLS